ncbi:uncharacterized protein LOC105833437 isoform X2 [Monomorium pharaonis]|uniref:uncharacterized protein LOC105833437 isoform X2 n=1 Tax=Monomorium pharaonis TaxID=307658 RepID=UPI00063F8470|nr:uncharacterized protein LOC105833437 isoform X2 [Monomorium pharaonis]
MIILLRVLLRTILRLRGALRHHIDRTSYLNDSYHCATRTKLRLLQNSTGRIVAGSPTVAFAIFISTVGQSAVSTRSKTQKVNNAANQDVDKSVQKIKQSQKKTKSAAKQQIIKDKSPKVIESPIKKSTTKKTSRRRLNLDKKGETEDTSLVRDCNMDSNESIKILRDNHCDNIATVELIRTNLTQLNATKDLKKVSNSKLQQKTSGMSVKLSPLIVTPKSTPPKLSLTPHRSKKTPKKSPIALGSPKTHSLAIPKLLKSPRKLSLAAADEESPDRKVSAASPKIKHKKSDRKLKTMVRKFSKSPKIVLKLPKSKSKSHKLKLSPSQTRKNSLKTSSSTATSNFSQISANELSSPKRKNLSPIKRRLLNSKTFTKTLTASQIKDVLAEPVVLLEKLSPEDIKRKYTPSKTQLNTSLKVNIYPLIDARRESEVIVKRIFSDVSPKRNSSTKLRSSSTEKLRISNTNKISPKIKHNTLIQEKERSSVPLMSSTPREDKTQLMDTSFTSNTSIVSVNNTSLNARLRHRSQSNVHLSSITDKNTDIENVSRPSLFDKEISNTSQSRSSSVVKRDVTYDKNNTMEKGQGNMKDNTYELEQPQTLNLQQMINNKRISVNANLNLKDTIKKPKVRFADITSDSANARQSINKKSSPRTYGGTPQARVSLSKIQVTPKTKALVENKSDKKSSMKKKIPNFGKIHEQMFAKSESLVDAKKRLEARHLAFTTNKTISKVNVKTEGKKPLPTDTKDGIHNRFGYRLKKPEATHLVLKKQTVFSREKQKHETRMMLQGVRTNRRFELQMKARNLDPS